jgi:hypothetical protein
MKSLVSNTHRIALAAAAALSSLVMTLPSSASAADHASYVLFAPGNDSTSMSGSVKPQAEMGARQAELGSRQAALGSKQAALGAQQAHLGALQADARPSEQDELGRQQDALGRQQDELGKQQSALGEQHDALGREQDRLGRIARDKFDALLADALKRGVAQRVD